MAPPPQISLALPLQAFSRCAVDFGGSFLTKQGRGKKRAKWYLCLFTCLASSAVHLEIACGLDTDSFLNAFYRMTNQELPVEMLSDINTNFVCGEQELRALIQVLDAEKIVASGADKGIKWNSNLPLAPHFGGAQESMKMSAKKAIKVVAGNADVNVEELLMLRRQKLDRKCK